MDQNNQNPVNPTVATPATDPAADAMGAPAPVPMVDPNVQAAPQSFDANQVQSPTMPSMPDPVAAPVAEPLASTPMEDPNAQTTQESMTSAATKPQPDADQSQMESQPAPTADDQGANYIDDVGGSVLELLDDIDADENLQQTVANEMRLDAPKVKEILSGLLNKINQGQITTEELALLMAAPVVDEASDTQ